MTAYRRLRVRLTHARLTTRWSTTASLRADAFGILTLALVTACDDSSTRVAGNNPPVILSLVATPAAIPIGGVSTVTANATDPDGDKLTYRWESGLGVLTGTGPTVQYTAESCCPGSNLIVLRVEDGKGGEVQADVTVTVGP